MSVREKIIVTGGAGYLGRCAVEILTESGYHPIIIDNFSTSTRKSVEGIDSFEVDLINFESARRVFQQIGKADALIHFAAKALVHESILKPALYFSNNVNATLNVAELCAEFGIEHLIHSSSCSVYGVPNQIPIPESSQMQPVSPYGESKYLSERILHQYERAGKLRVLQLRYFNPVGCVGSFGEVHSPETHLVPCVIDALVNKKKVTVFGKDYDTPDGTCVRDYVHVRDLIEAHVTGIEWLKKNKGAAVNLGTGVGYSVLEVIRTAERVSGLTGEIDWQPRREGDPPALIASVATASRLLGWTAKRDLSEMIRDHYNFVRERSCKSHGV